MYLQQLFPTPVPMWGRMEWTKLWSRKRRNYSAGNPDTHFRVRSWHRWTYYHPVTYYWSNSWGGDRLHHCNFEFLRRFSPYTDSNHHSARLLHQKENESEVASGRNKVCGVEYMHASSASVGGLIFSNQPFWHIATDPSHLSLAILKRSTTSPPRKKLWSQ